jgi:TRAP-type C4-dicarboxylate transport system, large permease component
MPLTMFVTMLVLFGLSVPIAISIGLASVLGAFVDPTTSMLSIGQQLFISIDKYVLAAIPFFILAGNLMESGGISRRMVNFAKSVVGNVQGGLACTCVLTCMIFAAVSGSGVATTFAIGAIMIPAMVRQGYPAPFAASVQATSAELGVILPPSIPMILFAVSAEVSVGELFIAGIGPGLFIGGSLILLVWCWAKIKGYGKRDAEGNTSLRIAVSDLSMLVIMIVLFVAWHFILRSFPFLSDVNEGTHFTLATLLTGLVGAVVPEFRRRLVQHAALTLLMPVVILGGIYGGVVTPTEASAIAVAYALFIGVFVYREIGTREIVNALHRTMISTCVIMFIIACAGVFSFLLTRAGVPAQLAHFINETLHSPWTFLMAINLTLFLIGMFIDGSALIIVLAPILVPVAISFGIDPIHFGTIMVVNIALGMITPPLALNLFAAASVAKIPLEAMVRPLIPFVLTMLGCLLVITYWPPLSLFLRDLVY